MIISKENSARLVWLSYLAALMVVFLHSYYWPFAHQKSLTSWIEEFVCQGFTRFAVPYFFTVAGALLFKDYGTASSVWGWWRNKVRSRIFTLVVPYLIWITISMLLPILRASRVPADYDFTNVTWWFRQYGVICQPQVAYHLWFVRVLFIGVLGSPLIGFIVARSGLLLPVLGYVLTLSTVVGFDYSQFLCYFSFGAWIAIHVDRIMELDAYLKKHKRIVDCSVVLWLMVCFILTCQTMLGWTQVVGVMRGMIPCALVAFWYKVGKIKPCSKWMRIGGASFFIYCSHGLFGASAEHVSIIVSRFIKSDLIYWCVRPVFLSVALTFAFMILLKVPKLLALLTGGRLVRQ